MTTQTPKPNRRLAPPAAVLATAHTLLGESSPNYIGYGDNAVTRLNAARYESPLFIETIEAHLTRAATR